MEWPCATIRPIQCQCVSTWNREAMAQNTTDSKTSELRCEKILWWITHWWVLHIFDEITYGEMENNYFYFCSWISFNRSTWLDASRCMAMVDKFIVIGRTGTDTRVSTKIPDEWQSIMFDELGYVFGTCSGRRQNAVSWFSCTIGTSDESSMSNFITRIDISIHIHRKKSVHLPLSACI